MFIMPEGVSNQDKPVQLEGIMKQFNMSDTFQVLQNSRSQANLKNKINPSTNKKSRLGIESSTVLGIS